MAPRAETLDSTSVLLEPELDPVFRLVADVNADQTTEIERMQLMLEALQPRSPE